MSLLLDALKKAEEAKRQAAGDTSLAAQTASATTAPAAGLTLEPVAPPPPPPATPPAGGAGSPLPALSDHLDTVNADLAAITTVPPLRSAPAPEAAKRAATARPQPDPAAEQEAVRNVFAAKRTPLPRRTGLWIALAAAAIGALGIGGWLWWQLNSLGSGSLTARPAQATTTQPVTMTPAAPTPPVAALPPATEPAAVTTGVPAPPSPPAATATPAAATNDAQPPARSERRASPPVEPDGPLRITRGELKVPSPLARAYELLEANELAGAAQAYGQALKADPKSTDALLGMAALAIRNGDLAAAESWYLRALEADPRDANAHAGLANLRGQADPLATESRLKGLLASQPDSAPLNFALGNLYAAQRRWPEAQLAYFNAHTADPSNPDYLFNLAACLDQMHLPKIALDYYKAALVATSSRRAAFNAEQVKARIAELQP